MKDFITKILASYLAFSTHNRRASLQSISPKQKMVIASSGIFVMAELKLYLG